MEYIALGIATAFNFIVLKLKIESGRYSDVILDIFAIVVLMLIFGGTLGGMIISMVASAIISLYLLVYPPRFQL